MMETQMKKAGLAISAALAGLVLVTPAEAAAPRGPVHNQRAAILMARKIWISLFPDQAVKAGSEKAWLAEEKASRDGDIWEVSPKNLSPTALGSGFTFRISSDDGRMVSYYNPQ
jgi:hypothetical protein